MSFPVTVSSKPQESSRCSCGFFPSSFPEIRERSVSAEKEKILDRDNLLCYYIITLKY